MATAEQLRELRRKHGLGEFRKKGRVKVAPPPGKTRPRAKGNVKAPTRKQRIVPRGTFVSPRGRTMADEVRYLNTTEPQAAVADVGFE